MYISEIAEDSIRGTLGTLFQLMLTFGILLVYLIGAVVSWTTLSVLCLMVPLALFVGMLFLPETPTYLLKKVKKCLNLNFIFIPRTKDGAYFLESRCK